MKILSMTATFGKLDHQTLELRPGLQVVEAPNEWGKSTWCAFMVAMLYGISTFSRKKTDFLPDKERYAPWNGKAMAGRMEVQWQGRNITIERSAKGRIPFGNFRAYETESGIEVSELTAENCGQTLLGVEREVFTRAGFLRGTDLPVAEDEALRRRLNALVTTGEESAAGDVLAKKLKDLRNECRHNKTGLLPQAEQQRDQLIGKLNQLTMLQEQTRQLQEREAYLTEYADRLKNHQAALAYEKSLQTQAHIERANRTLAAAEEAARQAEDACRDLPTRQTAENELQRLGQLQSQWALVQAESEQLPIQPQPVETPAPFAGKTPDEAIAQAKAHGAEYRKLCKPVSPLLLILAILALAAAVAMVFVNWIISLPCVVAGAVLLAVYLQAKKTQAEKAGALKNIYANENPESWLALAGEYAEKTRQYQAAQAAFAAGLEQVRVRKESLKQSMDLMTQGKSLAQALEYWQQVLQMRQDLQEKQRNFRQAQENAQAVSGLAQTAPKPEMPDTLTLTEDQTEQELQRTILEQNQLHNRLGQCQGQMETLGDELVLKQQLQQVRERIAKLEDHYGALTMALETLTQATTELQRRFAPVIRSRAGELFSRLTGGRYERLLLASDFSMEVAANDEDTTHGVLWRSDGTADQLYLALRLAVAEELTPDAPLVLDDAFVRFDDTRLATAMEILKEYAENKQVILFTCQTREKKLVE